MFSATVSASPDTKITRTTAAMELFEDVDGGIIGVSSKGMWDFFPENSIPAITAAAQTDIHFVLINVKITADGTLIVFSDNDTQRMTDSDTVYTIKDTDYSILSELYLKESCGGKSAKVTQYKIPKFEEALICANQNDIPLILECEANIIPQISDLLSKYNVLDTCIIMTSSPVKELKQALSLCTDKPKIIGSKRGNVIFSMNSYVNDLSELNALGVDLKTTNRYGINYYKSVVGNFSSKMRVIADPTTPEVCGARQDCEKWWNDLISRGYSVIFTDYPELFCDYIKRNDAARAELEETYTKHVTEKILPDGFDKITLNDTKKAYTDAADTAKTLLADNSSSLLELSDCIAALRKASNDVSTDFEALESGTSGTTYTVARIILCIAAAAVVITVQIYFYKKRKKEA